MRIHRTWLFLILAAFTVFGFQNCSRYDFKAVTGDGLQKSLSSGLGGNGGGYEGKLQGSYYHFVPGFTCEGTPAHKDLIQITDDKILLFENKLNKCAQTSRTLRVSDLSVSPFQNEFISYKGSVYRHYETRPVGIPTSLADLVCRDDFDRPRFEIISLFDPSTQSSRTRIYSYNSTGVATRFEDPNSVRLMRTPKLAEYSSFSGALVFKLTSDQYLTNRPRLSQADVIAATGAWSPLADSKKLTCVNGSYLEPTLKFTGPSDLTNPVSTRILPLLAGAWTFTGECTPSLGSVTLSGEALNVAVTTPCDPTTGTFSTSVNGTGSSAQFTSAIWTAFGLPQVLATQGTQIAMTRIYRLPLNATVVYVSTASELQNISINGFAADFNRAIILTADIDLSTVSATNNFTRLGPGSSSANQFNSTFYGDGHIISNLNITSDTMSYPSLFGYFDQAVVTDLHFRNAKIQTRQSEVGILAGYMRTASAYRVSATGSVNGQFSVGGLVGHGWDVEIFQSWFEGSVQADSIAGGIIGILWDNWVTDSWSAGSVSTTTAAGVAGGIVGRLDIGSSGAHIYNAYSSANISGENYLGGLIGSISDSGSQTSNPRNSFASGSIQLASTNVLINHYAGPAIGMAGTERFGTYTASSFITLTNIFSLASATCSQCTPVSSANSQPKTWPELNTFAETTWDFREVWYSSAVPSASPPTLRFNP